MTTPMQATEQAAGTLRDAGIEVRQNEPLERHTSFRIGGPAAVFCVPENPQQLSLAVKTARGHDLPCFYLGKGSNILFRDEGYPGVIIQLARQMGEITIEGDEIEAGAGAFLSDLCEAARDASLSGLEFAYGIPGSVGGAVFMDAGAYGGEMRQVLTSVCYLDDELQVVNRPARELELGYRCSIFQRKPWCILSARLKLKPGDRDAISGQMAEHMWQRRQKQPLDMPSAGSAFKRPKGGYASALIDQSGLRGYRVGGAAVSEKHCGFIVNLGGATCADVLELARRVENKVMEKTGIELEKEIRVVPPR